MLDGVAIYICRFRQFIEKLLTCFFRVDCTIFVDPPTIFVDPSNLQFFFIESHHYTAAVCAILIVIVVEGVHC